ncbi:aspartic peptidase domain-containing protein [Mycena olivaceomarginata]|nr:aspartic peptidase domain-containing protein [Mycena olivaceomarginata]
MPRICRFLITILGFLYFAAGSAIEDSEQRTVGSFSLPVSRASERYQASKRSTTGSVFGTHAHGDILVDITVGSQTLPVMFDTASSLLWVWSTYYTGSPPLSQGFYYNISASSTWAQTQTPGYTYAINYVSGPSTSGVVGTDKVTVAGITFTGTALGAANSGTPNNFLAGVIGMQRGSVINIKNSAGIPITMNTFMQNIAPSLASHIFAVYLPWGTGAKPSSIDFGFINSTKAMWNRYTGTLSTVPLIPSSPKWAFNSTSYYVNGVHHGVTFTTNGNAMIDTRTTLLQVYPEIASTFYAAIPGSYQDPTTGVWGFPCSTTTFPSLTLNLGDVQAPVSHNINWSPSNPYTTLPNGTKICGGGIQASTNLQMIFGEIFLASNYVVFNDATGTIQIANIVF